MTSFSIAAVLAVAALAGCASADQPANPDPVSTTDRVYRPGSNILIKDRRPLTQEEKDQQAEDSRKLLSTTQRPVVK